MRSFKDFVGATGQRQRESPAIAGCPISIPRTESTVIQHFQERMPYGVFVPEVLRSLDHLIGARKQLRRHIELDRSRSLKVDYKLELG